MIEEYAQVVGFEGDDIWVEDPTNEIAWHVFKKKNERFLWLLNTDWVVAQNHKTVTVHTQQGCQVVDVHQGKPVCVRVD